MQILSFSWAFGRRKTACITFWWVSLKSAWSTLVLLPFNFSCQIAPLRYFDGRCGRRHCLILKLWKIRAIWGVFMHGRCFRFEVFLYVATNAPYKCTECADRSFTGRCSCVARWKLTSFQFFLIVRNVLVQMCNYLLIKTFANTRQPCQVSVGWILTLHRGLLMVAVCVFYSNNGAFFCVKHAFIKIFKPVPLKVDGCTFLILFLPL